ncbi:MAG: PAS domain-containing protein [Polyangiaceae bacterium]
MKYAPEVAPRNESAHSSGVFKTGEVRSEDPVSAIIRSFQASSTAIALVTAKSSPLASRVVWVNTAFTELTGYASEEVLGRPGILLGGARLDLHHLRQLEALSDEPAGEPWVLVTTKERPDRTRFQVEVTINAVKNPLGEITHYVVAQREILGRANDGTTR